MPFGKPACRAPRLHGRITRPAIPYADPLIDPIVTDAEVAVLVSSAALVARMLDVEAALARAEADCGIIPAAAADAIAAACRADLFDHAALGAAAAEAGNVAIPLVKALTAQVASDARGFVHWGATSQDIVDTATVLQLRDALALVEGRLARLAAALAALAALHRATPMAGRTWLQHALPTTFGLKAAGWLDAVTRHRARLAEAKPRVLTLQFGGAAGTLASLGEAGPAVIARLAERLALSAPDTPWHSARDRMGEVATILGLLTGSLGKIARDVSLMMQTEVAEAFEAAAPGRGGSSTMPHKRNPVACAAILAAAAAVPNLVAAMLAAEVAEHERSAGAWTLEWRVLPEIVRLAGGALGRTVDLIEGLEVDAARMRANLDATRGLVMAEAVMMALAPHLGRLDAHHLVEEASRKALADGRHLKDVLRDDGRVTAHLDAAALDRLFDPLAYLGSADTFIAQALATHARTA